MKCVPMLLASYAVLSTMMMTASEKQKCQEQVAIEAIEVRLMACRQTIQQLVHDNPKVIHQFDRFIDHLKQAYLSGEGFIHKDIHRVIDAIVFAAEKHRFQTRKDSDQTPYIIHPLGVADNLIAIGHVRDPDIIIGALLHDTVEDTQTTFEEIEQIFGLRVATFVQEVTDDKSLPKQLRKKLQIDHASEKSAGAAQIKLADKLYNLIDLSNAPPLDWDVNRVNHYFLWVESVIDNLPWVNAPLKQAVVEEIERYWQNKS